MTRITGNDAIEYAARYGLTLAKYADPVDGARDGLTVEEAEAVAAQDPGLVYIDLRVAQEVDMTRAWAPDRTPAGDASACLVQRGEDGRWLSVLTGHPVAATKLYDSKEAAVAAARRRWKCNGSPRR